MPHAHACLNCHAVAEGGFYPFCVRKRQPHVELGGRPACRVLHRERAFVCSRCATRYLRGQAWLFLWAACGGLMVGAVGAVFHVVFLIPLGCAVLALVEAGRRFLRLFRGYAYVEQHPDPSVTQFAIRLRRQELLKELRISRPRDACFAAETPETLATNHPPAFELEADPCSPAGDWAILERWKHSAP